MLMKGLNSIYINTELTLERHIVYILCLQVTLQVKTTIQNDLDKWYLWQVIS